MLGLFLLLSRLVRDDNSWTQFDDRVHTTLLKTARQTPALTGLLRACTVLGDVKTLALLSVCITAGWGVRLLQFRDTRDRLIFWIITILGAGILNVILKTLFQRPRPDQENALAPATGWSFPSGHAMGSLVVFGMLVYLLLMIRPQRAWRLFAVVVASGLVLAIGFSRVYLGAHWVSDVLGGYLAGASWLAFCMSGYEFYRSAALQSRPRSLPPEVRKIKPSVGLRLPTQRRPAPWQRAKRAEGGDLVGLRE